MKKTLFITAFAVMILAVVPQAMAQLRANGTMYVSVQTATLKSGTGWFASNRGTLRYGDRVEVIQVSGNFAEVRSYTNRSLTGWMPSANLSQRQLVTGTSGSVSASETAMAGKGFSPEVEAEYRTQNRELNYADVDRVENIRVSEADLRRFLEEGRLFMGE